MKIIIWAARVTLLALQTLYGQERELKQQVPSRFLGAERTVRIYLPASYGTAAQRHYPVLYLHDGQNVFSSAGTNIAFGWGSWRLDETADQLSRGGRMEEVDRKSTRLNSSHRL